MGFWKKLFGKGRKKTEHEAAHLRIKCPRCGKSFETEALLGVEFVIDVCPYCHSSLMINLFLDKVIKVQPFGTQEELVEAVEAAGRMDTEEEWKALKPQLEKDTRFVSNLERASALIARGQYEEASRFLLNWYREDLSVGQRSVLDLLLGNAYKGIGRFDYAERYYETAVRRARASQYPPRSPLANVKTATFSRENARYLDTEAAALGNIGQIQASRGNLTKAEEYLRQSLEIYRGLSQKLSQDERGQANQLLSLGMVYMSQGRFQLAEENLKEAARLFRRIGDSKLLALTESARARLRALF